MRTCTLARLLAILIFAVALAGVLGVEAAHAQGSFVPLAPAPGGSRLGDLYGTTTTSLGSFINKLFVAALSLGAILAVLRLAYAGYLYMTTDAWGTKGKAKEVIGDVIIGLLLLLSIWLILRQINPQLLDLNVLKNLKPLPAVQQSTQQTQTYQRPADTNVNTGLQPGEESQTTGGAIMP